MAAVVGAVLITIVVGAFTDVIPRAGIFDPRARTRLRHQLEGSEPPSRAPRPAPTRAR